MPRHRIMVIEDDADLSELLRINLTQSGYEVEVHRDGTQGLQAVLRHPPDLLLLDLLLPGTHGLDALRSLRSSKQTKWLPIIIISIKGSETDIVLGLELGADDYLDKPFGMSELESRIKAILRRCERGVQSGTEEDITVNGLHISPTRFTVSLRGKEIQLTRTEFRLLAALASNEGLLMTRESLKEVAFPEDAYVDDHNIDVHMSSLRKKLGPARKMTETVWGMGYRFRPELGESIDQDSDSEGPEEGEDEAEEDACDTSGSVANDGGSDG